MIGVINLGNSNLLSLTNSLDYLNIKYIVIQKPDELKLVNKIIFPGVGTFGDGVNRLKKSLLFDAIIQDVKNNKKPILGICLGMQLLFEDSEEDPNVKGLGLVEGNVLTLPKSERYTIPRIGWAESIINFNFLSLQKNDKLDFYYIHSFYVKPKNQDIVSISTETDITAAIHYNNIYGCQFHPEKSHVHGLKILKEFAKITKGNIS